MLVVLIVPGFVVVLVLLRLGQFGLLCEVLLWEVGPGSLKHTIDKHSAAVTACAWLPDSARFVTGGHDRHMYLWDVAGTQLRQVRAAWVTRLCLAEGRYEPAG